MAYELRVLLDVVDPYLPSGARYSTSNGAHAREQVDERSTRRDVLEQVRDAAGEGDLVPMYRMRVPAVPAAVISPLFDPVPPSPPGVFQALVPETERDFGLMTTLGAKAKPPR